MGHQNREAMAHGGVRVEPTVRLGAKWKVLISIEGIVWVIHLSCGLL